MASDARTIPSGRVSVSSGSISFNPAGLFDDLDVGDTRTVTVPYTMRDDDNATATATLTVTITGVNDAPSAVADVNSTDEDTAVLTSVLSNDTDPDDVPANFLLVSIGTLSVSPTRTLTGTPATIVGNQIQFKPCWAIR